jgi:hypothetical protein
MDINLLINLFLNIYVDIGYMSSYILYAQWPYGQYALRAITEVKQRWSVIGWVTKNLLSRASPCFGRQR